MLRSLPPRRPARRATLAALVLAAALGCAPADPCAGDRCGTLVIAAPGSPASLLPPVIQGALDRDISDQLFLRLADLRAGASTIGDSGFAPQLAQSWRWEDPRTLTFTLDPRARWHDGARVTALDVAFTFKAYADSALGANGRPALARIASVTAKDSVTVTFAFTAPYPEAFFDATYHMRILPAHLLGAVPRAEWRSHPFGRSPVGNGPYRFVKWDAEQAVTLEADTSFFLGRPHLARLVWRFAADLPSALQQVLAKEADAIEVLVSPPNVALAEHTGHLAIHPYPGGTYAFLRFNTKAAVSRAAPHPVLADADVRRALVLAVDRASLAQNVFGGRAKVPPGPMPLLWGWLWAGAPPVPPFDTTQAARLLDAGGWTVGPGGVRRKGGRPLAFSVMVPSTSAGRKQYAVLLQEQLKRIGADVTIEEVDLPTMMQRLQAGRFETAIEAMQGDPTPATTVGPLWESGGEMNFGRYANPAFDTQVAAARSATEAAAAQAAWQRAFAALAADPPAMMLFAPENVAAIDRRFADVTLRGDGWLAHVRQWRVPPEQLTERDKAGR
ncbi:MAG: peptide ABC transporter substrate-binding protein [Gemmatimonadaceae bacterium]|nr:peptide ABC transporter substrate-binding protein [Gemmatimonadaceae bacterium]